jgi:alanyl-tRNA synthetase
VSHFQKITDQEIAEVEKIVNQKIRENIALREDREIGIEEAKKAGAMMLFGEKYGDKVRMITFDSSYSRELCGGCHAKATGQLGLFKIVSEGGIAAGVRRVEALTSVKAESFVGEQLAELNAIRSFFKTNANAARNVAGLQEENKELQKELERMRALYAEGMKDRLVASAYTISGVKVVKAKVADLDMKACKTLAANILQEINDGIVLLGILDAEKASLMLHISDGLVASRNWHAGNMVKELGKEIQGGGGGQAFFATAGGQFVQGLDKALEKLDSML